MRCCSPVLARMTLGLRFYPLFLYHEKRDLLGDSSNIVWATGPSKTADVEGILIEGVHGPGEEIALLVP